jgi:hypothetical protein
MWSAILKSVFCNLSKYNFNLEPYFLPGKGNLFPFYLHISFIIYTFAMTLKWVK